jgi:site-specific recombinase XerD
MSKQKSYVITADKFFAREERAKLLKTCKDKADLDLLHGRRTWVNRYMLVDLALFSGLRVAEIADLKIGDLNLKAKDPYLIVRRGKGSRKRDVYLDKELVRHLNKFTSQKKKAWGESVEPDAPLFAGRGGRHCVPITLMKSFKRAVKEAGLPAHYSIHSARHTYATFLLHDTGNLKYVQKQLGHSNIGMTSVYSDILPEERGSLANKIVRDEL